MKFEDFYYNPLAVLLALFLIIFSLVYVALFKTFLKKNKSVAFVIALVTGFYSVYYIQKVEILWILNFNFLLILAIAGILILFIKPFLRFLKVNI